MWSPHVGDAGAHERVDLGPPRVDRGGEGDQLGDLGVDTPGQQPVQPVPGQVRIPAHADRGQQGAQLLLRDPGRQDLRAGVLVADPIPHLGEALARQAFPGGEQPASVGPLRVDLAATPIAQVPGDAAAHPAERVVGQLHQVEVVDHDRRVRQQPLGAQRRRVHRGRIDRHVLDSLPELRCSCLQPFDHRGAGAAGALSQQPLLAVQIDEPGVPRIHPHPPLRFAAVLPSGSATAGLVDPQHPHRFRLDQPRFGLFDEGAVRGRPRHSMRGSDLRYRPGRIPIADPIWARNRRVVRARGGTSGIASVNDPTPQDACRHLHRVLHQRTRIPFSP